MIFLHTFCLYILRDINEEEIRVVIETMKANASSGLVQRAGAYIIRRLAYYPMRMPTV